SASTTSLREHELDQVLRVCSQPLAGHPVSITDCTRRRPLGAPDLVELPPSSWSCGTSASWAGAPTRARPFRGRMEIVTIVPTQRGATFHLEVTGSSSRPATLSSSPLGRRKARRVHPSFLPPLSPLRPLHAPHHPRSRRPGQRRPRHLAPRAA